MPDDTSTLPEAPAIPTAPTAPSGLSAALEAASPIQAPDLPRFQRTFGNTLKSMLIGLGGGGVIGAIAGGINPGAIEQARQQAAQEQQTQQTFKNAQAAKEVAAAHLEEAQYRDLPNKLQDEAETRGLQKLNEAQKAGYAVVAATSLDQDQAQNVASAMGNINKLQSQFGAVPDNMLHIHVGDKVLSLKQQDPNAALPMINNTRQLQGLAPIDSSTFTGMPQADKEKFAKDSIDFFDPKENGKITEGALNTAKNSLLQVKAQAQLSPSGVVANTPEQADAIKRLQTTIDHYTAVLKDEATRQGEEKGATAQAAEPGETAAKISAQGKFAQTPEGRIAAKQAEANLAKTQAETQKAIADTQKTLSEAGTKPLFAFDPATKQNVQTTADEARAKGYTNLVPVKEGDIEKARTETAISNDVITNAVRYRGAMERLGDNPASRLRLARALNESGFKDIVNPHGAIGIQIPFADAIDRLEKGNAYKALTPPERDAMDAFIGVQTAMPGYVKMLTGSGRVTESQLKLELQQLADPSMPRDAALSRIKNFQNNVDVRTQGIPKLPGITSPREKRAEAEAEETQKPTSMAAPAAPGRQIQGAPAGRAPETTAQFLKRKITGQ